MKLDSNVWYRAMAPRLTVLVSTADKDGRTNVAPFSFCMPVSMEPPLIAVSMAPKRHTLANIRETGEFVVNLPGEWLVAAVWKAGDPIPKEESEFDHTGLRPGAAETVKVPFVKDCTGYFECKTEWERDAGDHVVVVGRVTNAVVKDELWVDGDLDFQNALNLLHLGGRRFTVAEREIISNNE
jgi:flavin reductase (DIM6/NTAB) family NADH-FMN oxidoreductase RutF